MIDVTFFLDGSASNELTDAGYSFTRYSSSSWVDGDTETIKFTTKVPEDIIDSLDLDSLVEFVGIPSDSLIHLSF